MRAIRIMAAAVIVGALALGLGGAVHAADGEYKRGYDDCLAGRYDQDKHNESYKQGCRAAEDKLAKSCPPDVSQADRYKYPACNDAPAKAAAPVDAPKAAQSACREKAAHRWSRAANDVYVKSTERSGKHHFMIHVASGKHVGKCEVGGDGDIKTFSDWKE